MPWIYRAVPVSLQAEGIANSNCPETPYPILLVLLPLPTYPASCFPEISSQTAYEYILG